MYIEPNSDLYILRGVEADRDFKNVKYFADRSSQMSYMQNHAKKYFPRLSYVRDNVIKVEGSADQFYDCNYLMYRNTAFGNKWFFAFIDRVRYNNNNTCTIDFTIDNFQTWFLDCQLGQCYVEREHVVDDTMFAHTLEEGLPTGELMCSAQTKLTNFTDSVTYCLEFVLNESQLSGIDSSQVVVVSSSQNKGNVVNGCSYAYSATAQNIIDFAKAIVEAGYSSAVQSIYSVPINLAVFSNNEQIYSEDIAVPDLPNNFDGYVPHNNKLYCYPYSSYLLYSPSGSNLTLQPQYFTGEKKIKLRGNLSVRSTVLATPVNYKGITDNLTMGVKNEYGILGSFSYDSYQAMIASYGMPNGDVEFMKYTLPKINAGLGFIGGFAGAVRSALTGDIVGATTGAASAGTSLISGIGNSMMQEGHDQHDTTRLSGSYGNDVLWSTGIQEFYLQAQQVRREVAETVDQFFDMFGYKVNTVKVPNINSRPSWNYVKCQTFVANGNIPSDVDEFLKQVFLQGVTFWKTTMGNYSANNK